LLCLKCDPIYSTSPIYTKRLDPSSKDIDPVEKNSKDLRNPNRAAASSPK
jgi:hypothetical protein